MFIGKDNFERKVITRHCAQIQFQLERVIFSISKDVFVIFSIKVKDKDALTTIATEIFTFINFLIGRCNGLMFKLKHIE